jgi:hypothetical protein
LARVALEQGIRAGVDSVPGAPPAVSALLTHAERLLECADEDLLDRGSAAYFAVPTPVHAISLSAGALVYVYRSSAITAMLGTTRHMIDKADGRIRETGKWISTAMLPGSLYPGRPGYVATLKVRMLHAHARHIARAQGFDQVAYGAPINQIDLARTWIGFTFTTFRAEGAIGFGLDPYETSNLYRYWLLLGQLLGIDSRLIGGVSSDAQACQLNGLLEALAGPPGGESAILVAAALSSIAGMIHGALHIPNWLGVRVLESLVRRFHGDTVAEELHVRSSFVADAVISSMVKMMRAYRASVRREPGKSAADRARNVAIVQRILASNPGLFEGSAGMSAEEGHEVP